MRTYESARPAPPALSPHALHVHPLRSEGSTRFVRASGSPVHSSGSLDTTMGGTVRLVTRVDKSDKKESDKKATKGVDKKATKVDKSDKK